MKNFIVLILFLGLLSQAALCAAEKSPRQRAYLSMQDSNKMFYKQCNELANSFKKDASFANFMRNTCSDYEFKREKSIGIIFAQRNNYNITNTPNYYSNMSKFASVINDQNMQINREIAKEYCKYNKKKFPEACSAL